MTGDLHDTHPPPWKITNNLMTNAWVKAFRIVPELKILRLTFLKILNLTDSNRFFFGLFSV